MKHIVDPLVSPVAVLVVIISVAMAQTTPTLPAAPPPPGGLRITEGQPPMASSPPAEKVIDGPVKKIDPASQSIQVGWLLGLFRTTLEVIDDTHIAVDGVKASLPDIREGDEVKASYEEWDGKNLAKSIEVIPVEVMGGTGTQSRAPAFPTSPQ